VRYDGTSLVMTILLGVLGITLALFAPQVRRFNQRMLPASLRNLRWHGNSDSAMRMGGFSLVLVCAYLLVRYFL
jgi:hypothetical protein